MKTISTITLVLGMALPAEAEGFKANQVPANSQWFMHLDIDGFKKTQLGKFVLGKAKEFEPELDALTKQLQFDVRKDLESATLFGQVDRNGDNESMAALLRGNFKKEPLLKNLQTADAFRKLKAAGHEFYTWRDKNKDRSEMRFGAIVNEGLIALGNSRQQLVQTLNLLKGKAPGLKPQQLAGLNLKPGAYFLAGVVNVKDLPVPPQARAFKVQSIGFKLGEHGPNLKASVRLNSADAKASVQIQQMLQGLLAMGRIQAEADQRPEVKELAGVLDTIKITQKGNAVDVHMAYPVATILKNLELNVQNQKGKEGGRVELRFGTGRDR